MAKSTREEVGVGLYKQKTWLLSLWWRVIAVFVDNRRKRLVDVLYVLWVHML